MGVRNKEFVQFKIRISKSLLSQLRVAADKHGFSANNEAVVRLTRSFERDDREALVKDAAEAAAGAVARLYFLDKET